MQSFHYVDHPTFSSAYPISKIHIIWDCSTQHDESYMFRKHDNGFLPNHSSFRVVDIMHFVKYNPLNVSYHLSPSIQIVSQNFSSHDNATSLRIHRNITSDDTYRIELFGELSIFLVGKGFDWRGVDNFPFVFQSQSDTILRHYCFTSTGMCSHKNTLFLL